MRTLKSFKKEKQVRISKETMEIYAPIAHKLGMWQIKGELEDLALRYLKPEVYHFLRNKVNSKRIEREKQTTEIIKAMSAKLAKQGIKAKVYGRAKYFYSIYKKMIKKNLEFDQIYDLIALRVIVKNVSDCYAVLNVINNTWKPIPERFKDYISVPKPNEYQSIHTTVQGNNKIIEFQIRTGMMHRVAEHGIAVHWKYQGTERDKKFEQKIGWLKQLLDWRTSEEGHEFIESLKLDLFQNEIVAFTPKGDPISLTEGSTPIDFAFEVHINVGLACSKAMVNGKVVPLEYKLKPGDIVEIVTQKNVKPSRNWLKFVRSSKAKSKIKAHLNIESDSPGKKSKIMQVTKGGIEIGEDKFKKYPVKFSKCCEPIPPKPIIGYLTKDKKITIHAIGCPNIYSLTQNKEVPVSWTNTKSTDERILGISVQYAPGVLGEILTLLSRGGIKISNITSKSVKDHMHIRIHMDGAADKEVVKHVEKLREHKHVIDAKVISEEDA